MSDWKVSREELLHLLGAAPGAASAPGQVTGPAPTMPEVPEPNPERVAAESADSKPARMFTSAHFVLARALPRLWRLAQTKTEGADVRTQRRKLRELISWVLAKEGFVVEANATMPYQQEGETVAGRLELLVKAPTGEPVLAIETDWIGETS